MAVAADASLQAAEPALFVGLMSGTSLDGVDGVLAAFAEDGRPCVVSHAALGFKPDFKAELLALNQPGANELQRAALAANALARVYAQVVHKLLQDGGVEPGQINAIGAHGQTVRHRPGEIDGIGFSIQLNNAALLAELTGIRVACDFRSRDVAAGGQGAPLVPAFHRVMFGGSGADGVAVLNLGGIANLSLLGADGGVLGFDCGPGNALLDHWCQRHRGTPFDADGAWSAGGQVIETLLERLLREPYFERVPPKSTGRDLFNAAWLDAQLAEFANAAPVDVQATLAELTARAAVQSLICYGKDSMQRLIVCGGGALNGDLMRRLGKQLPGGSVESSQQHGLPPLQVEAAAFAWLAKQLADNRPTALSAVTGARGDRVLGCLYPA